MLYICGAGCAYPKNTIDNDFLCSVNPALMPDWISEHAGILRRATVMNLDYVRHSGNKDPWISKDYMLEQPSSLAMQAVSHALDRAGIDASQIGLIIGECAVPFETTPSEAQRVGNLLGLKVPAYDAFNCCGPIPLHLQILNSWNEERLPDYILLVSTNTPTQRIDYSKGVAGAFFGDAAAALVVSPRHRGRLEVLESQIFKGHDRPDLFEFPLYGVANIFSENLSGTVLSQIEHAVALAQQASPGLLAGENDLFVGPEIATPIVKDAAKALAMPLEKCWSSLENHGCSLGAGQVSLLAERWDELVGARMVVVQAAGSLGSGYCVLQG